MRLFFAVLVYASCLHAAAVLRGKLVRNRPDGDPIVGVSVTARDVANPAQSRAALTEALDIYSKFAERDPAQYGPFLRVVKEDLAKVAQ